MNPSSELFQLIKSMSGTEKRYFKVYSSKHIIGEQNSYVMLFDAIDKQKEYDEAELKNKFSGENFTKHFAWRKNYLYNHLLDSLQAYHLNLTADSVIRKKMQQVKILYDKGLYEQCRKLLEAIKEEAEEYENFSYMIEVCRWKKKLLYISSYYKMKKEDLLTVFEEESEIIKKQENFTAYSNLLHLLSYEYSRRGAVRTKEIQKHYNQILNTPLLKNESKAICIRSRRAFYNIHAIRYLFINIDYEKAYKYTKHHLQEIEKYPKHVEEDIHGYLTSLNNFIISSYMVKNIPAAYEGLDKLKNIAGNYKLKLTPNQEMKIFVRATLAELNIMSRTHNYANLNQLIAQVENGLHIFKGKIEYGKEAIMCYNLAEIFFLHEEYKKALEWTNKILNEQSSEVEQNIVSFTRLFQLIIHFELKNFDLIHYTLKSTKRFLDKKDRMHSGETIILNCLKNLLDSKNAEKGKAFLGQAYNDFVKLKEENAYEKTVLSYFDFISWAKSKIHKKPMLQIVKEK